MKKYIELTEYDSNERIVIFADSIRGLIRVRDRENGKEFTEVMVSGYTFIVNEPIDEILKRIERCIKEDEKAMQKINKIRAEIDVARFIDKDTKLCKNANASGLEVAMQIINKYMEDEDNNG